MATTRKRLTLSTAALLGVLTLAFPMTAPMATAAPHERGTQVENTKIQSSGGYKTQAGSARTALAAENERIANYVRYFNAALKAQYVNQIDAAQAEWSKARKTIRNKAARDAAKRRYEAAKTNAKTSYKAGIARVAAQAKIDRDKANGNYRLAVAIAQQTYDSEVAGIKARYREKEQAIMLAANQRQSDIDLFYTKLMMNVETDADYWRVSGEWKRALDAAWADYENAKDANEAEYNYALYASTIKYRSVAG